MEKSAIRIFAFLGAFLLMFFVFVYYHENVHKIIFNDYGVRAYIGIDVKGAYTYPNETDAMYLTEEEETLMNIMHEVNEIVAYNVVTSMFLLSFLLFIFLMFFYEKMEKIEEEIHNLNYTATKVYMSLSQEASRSRRTDKA